LLEFVRLRAMFSEPLASFATAMATTRVSSVAHMEDETAAVATGKEDNTQREINEAMARLTLQLEGERRAHAREDNVVAAMLQSSPLAQLLRWGEDQYKLRKKPDALLASLIARMVGKWHFGGLLHVDGGPRQADAAAGRGGDEDSHSLQGQSRQLPRREGQTVLPGGSQRRRRSAGQVDLVTDARSGVGSSSGSGTADAATEWCWNRVSERHGATICCGQESAGIGIRHYGTGITQEQKGKESVSFGGSLRVGGRIHPCFDSFGAASSCTRRVNIGCVAVSSLWQPAVQH